MLMTAALCAAGTPALAGDLTRTSDGYTYFHRPGADLAIHDADVLQCRTLAGRLHQPIASPGATVVSPAGTSAAAAGVGAAIGIAIAMAIQQKIADGKGNPVNIENCMVVHGWQVVALDEVEGKPLAEADAKAKRAQLAQWVGAAEPHGKVVRAFSNEVASADSKQQLFSLATKSGVSLSTDVVAKPSGKAKTPTATPAAYLPQPKPAKAPRMAKSARPPKPLAEADLGGVPADSGLVAVSVNGDAEISLTLERMGPDAATPAWVDGRPATLTVARPKQEFAKSGAVAGTTQVFAASPGRWRVASVTVDGVELSFCLGGPAFELAAGEVMYAGAFRPDRVSPDMDLAPAKAAFPALSPLGEQVKAAAWINGAQGQCSGVYAYVLELPDRPFLDGYALGGRARPSPQAAVAATAGSTVAP